MVSSGALQFVVGEDGIYECVNSFHRVLEDTTQAAASRQGLNSFSQSTDLAARV
jgi:hypothetical protein